jgi:hypothetical protein
MNFRSAVCYGSHTSPMLRILNRPASLCTSLRVTYMLFWLTVYHSSMHCALIVYSLHTAVFCVPLQGSTMPCLSRLSDTNNTYIEVKVKRKKEKQRLISTAIGILNMQKERKKEKTTKQNKMQVND